MVRKNFCLPRSICLSFLLLLCLCAARGEAAESGREKKLFPLSPSVGWFFPSSGKVQNAFGDSWGGLGVSVNVEAFGLKSLKAGKVNLSPYIGYFHAEKGDNEAHIIPLGLEAIWPLKESGNVKTYFGLGVAGYAVKFEDWGACYDTGWNAAGGGRIMLRADVSNWLVLQASYNAMTEVEGYNFSGFSIGAKIKIYF